MASATDMARAADQVTKAKKPERVQQLLTRKMTVMTKEELKESRLQLPDKDVWECSPGATPAQPENMDGLEMSSHLLASYRRQHVWNLALKTWKNIGLKKLFAPAQKEAAMDSGE